MFFYFFSDQEHYQLLPLFLPKIPTLCSWEDSRDPQAGKIQTIWHLEDSKDQFRIASEGIRNGQHFLQGIFYAL
jgi:hypothetical protein